MPTQSRGHGTEEARKTALRFKASASRLTSSIPRGTPLAAVEAPEAVNIALTQLLEQAVREPAVGRPTI